MLNRLRHWLSDDTTEEMDDTSWGLPVWWGAVVVALFTIAITWCHGPMEPVSVAAATSTTTTSTPPEPRGPNLLEVIDDVPELATFRSLLALAQVEEPVAVNQLTFFAPTDDAFATLPDDLREAVLTDPELAFQLLGAHVVAERRPITDLAAAGTVLNGNGFPITVTEAESAYLVDDIAVTRPDLEATNGYVHVIDGFIGLSDDVAAPPVSVGQLVAERTDLASLFAALESVTGELTPSDGSDFTLFAPTNAAFEQLPAGSMDLLLTTNAKLLELLGYHIVPGALFSADLTDGLVLVTSTGAELLVSVDGGIVRVGGATITEADLTGSNGVVHIVDGVLLPPQFELPTLNEALSLEPITFETASAVITPEGVVALQGTVEFLLANPEVRLSIEGHTDDEGTTDSNQRLSQNRADSVRDFLIEQGVAADRLETAGFGENRPVASNDTPEGRAANRRIEFRLL